MSAPSGDIPVTAAQETPVTAAQDTPRATGTPRLAVENLRILMTPRRGRPDADVIDEISFTVQPGHVLGLVGESGSGKTTVALALLGYFKRGLRPGGGKVLVDGQDILALPERELQKLRGRTIAYVPQDPGSALNPVLKIGTQLREVFTIHGNDPDRLTDVLAEAGLEDPAPILAAYPHQVSGGQQQRVALAMAFACRPRLIVLDEPTTGLDVTTQRRVLDTVRGLCRSYQVAAVYITHDLAVVAEIADHVAVLYAGRLIEMGQAQELFTSPAHPYTRGLMRAVPVLEGTYELHGMAGSPPRPGSRRPAASSSRGASSRSPSASSASRTSSSCPRPATPPGACAPWRSRRCPAPPPWPASARRPRPRRRCSPSAACRSPTRTSRCCVTSTSSWGPGSRSRLSAPRARARPRWPGASSGCTRTGRGRSRSTARISRPASAAGRRTSCAGSSSSRRTRTPRSTPGRPSARSSGSRSRTSPSCRARSTGSGSGTR